MNAIEKFTQLIAGMKADQADAEYAAEGFADAEERSVLRARAYGAARVTVDAFVRALRAEQASTNIDYADHSQAASAGQTQPLRKLVRILETYYLAELRGKLATLESRHDGVVQFTCGKTANGRSGYIANSEDVEILDASDCEKARVGDLVRMTVGSVTGIATVTKNRDAGGVYVLDAGKENIHIRYGSEFMLVSSDTPLEV